MIFPWFIFSMVMIRRVETGSGSRSGAGSQVRSAALDDRIREILREEVVAIFRDQIPELCGSIKTAMMEFFDNRYATVVETIAGAASATVVAAGVSSS